MARFQAQTNAGLDQELEELRERLGLREHQKAELLREIAALATWVVRRAEAGHRIEARRGRNVEVLAHPVIDRLREQQERSVVERIELSDAEVERLAQILDRGFSPTPALREALARLGDAPRRPPALRWQEGTA